MTRLPEEILNFLLRVWQNNPPDAELSLGDLKLRLDSASGGYRLIDGKPTRRLSGDLGEGLALGAYADRRAEVEQALIQWCLNPQARVVTISFKREHRNLRLVKKRGRADCQLELSEWTPPACHLHAG